MTQVRAKVVLTDIEGTTTSISFVKDVLFPYAKENTLSYLQETWNDDQTQNLINELLNLSQYQDYLRDNHKQLEERTAESVSSFVNYLIDRDLKVGPLKTLQGFVWALGYANGKLKGHVYDDVKIGFENWQQAGIRIAIYSSGSVKAQKLLFGQTELGNLLPFISAHFDTAVGHKQAAQSYSNIAQDLQVEPHEVLFLTDIYEEAKAAKSAGMQAIILKRAGNAPLTQQQEAEFIILNDFIDLHCQL